MELYWNLDELFTSYNDVGTEINKLNILLDEIQKYKEIDMNSSAIYNMLEDKWAIKEISNNILVYCSLRYYKDIKNEEVKAYKIKAEELENEVNFKISFIDKIIASLTVSEVNKYIEENNKLKKYELNIRNILENESHIKGIDSEKIKDLQNKISECLNKYNSLITKEEYGTININGKEEILSLSSYNKFIASHNPEIRKNVYLKFNEELSKFIEEYSYIFINLVKYRKELAATQKYSSVLNMNVAKENISEDIVTNLVNITNKNIDLMQRYLKIKTKLQNIKNPHVYDLSVPFIDINKKYSLEEGVNILKEITSKLGKEYEEKVDYLLKSHIDASVNKEKHPSITFSWLDYSFMNYKERFIDLKNLCHETGHIVNYSLSKDNLPFIYQDSSHFVCETASLLNEILLINYLIDNSANDEEKIYYISKEIETFINTVFNQVIYTEFELEVYNSEELTSAKLNEIFNNIRNKYYPNVIDTSDMFGHSWALLGRTFRREFYNYTYATSLIIASAVLNKIQNKELKLDNYIEFLKSGCSLNNTDILKILDIDLTKEDTLNNGFKILENDIDILEKLVLKK